MTTVHLKIHRFNPDIDKKPYMQDFEVTLTKPDMMLLGVLHLIREQDPTLALRRSCGEGVCGSDGMNINGKNGLACVTPISALSQPIIVKPLPGLPVERDLIVDMSRFYQNYERVEPWLQNENEPREKENLQSPDDRAKLDGLYECILCACCTTSCPSFWWNPDSFIGPAGLLQALRFILDSRDTAKKERLAKLSDPFSAYRCRGIMNCTTVCPKGLNPAKAVSDIRHELLKED